VVMRFAPNPNGPLTLGHARGVVVNSELVRKYGGTFILRFDDTDPRIKRPLLEAYDWIAEDCAWLEARPDKIYIASERIPTYYEYAEKLVELGKAYVCECEREEFKKLKDAKTSCKCYGSGNSLDKWRRMLSGGFEEGEAVLRIRTDITHPDPALRDWVAFRIIKEDHPRVGDKYVVWPMLDFESAIEDHLLEVTHIIRGKDLADSEKRQTYVYDYFGWKYPSVLHWGRISLLEYGKFSTSEISKGIKEGKFSGWDDPKLPTVRAFKRRGIKPQAIRNLMAGLGLSLNDITVSLENLYAENRKIVDGLANRFFYVEDPVRLVIKNPPCKTFRMPLHPVHRERGVREHPLRVEDKKTEVLISRADARALSVGSLVRLIGLCVVAIEEASDDTLVGSNSEQKTSDKIQWVQDGASCTLVTPEGASRGLCERGCLSLSAGDIIQFERVGFARLDEKRGDMLVFYLAHR